MASGFVVRARIRNRAPEGRGICARLATNPNIDYFGGNQDRVTGWVNRGGPPGKRNRRPPGVASSAAAHESRIGKGRRSGWLRAGAPAVEAELVIDSIAPRRKAGGI